MGEGADSAGGSATIVGSAVATTCKSKSADGAESSQAGRASIARVAAASSRSLEKQACVIKTLIIAYTGTGTPAQSDSMRRHDRMAIYE